MRASLNDTYARITSPTPMTRLASRGCSAANCAKPAPRNAGGGFLRGTSSVMLRTYQPGSVWTVPAQDRPRCGPERAVQHRLLQRLDVHGERPVAFQGRNHPAYQLVRCRGAGARPQRKPKIESLRGDNRLDGDHGRRVVDHLEELARRVGPHGDVVLLVRASGYRIDGRRVREDLVLA